MWPYSHLELQTNGGHRSHANDTNISRNLYCGNGVCLPAWKFNVLVFNNFNPKINVSGSSLNYADFPIFKFIIKILFIELPTYLFFLSLVLIAWYVIFQLAERLSLQRFSGSPFTPLLVKIKLSQSFSWRALRAKRSERTKENCWPVYMILHRLSEKIHPKF